MQIATLARGHNGRGSNFGGNWFRVVFIVVKWRSQWLFPPAELLTIVPTTIDSGAQALYWNVTVFNIDQVAPDDSYYSNFYFTTSKTVFLEYPASAPKIVVEQAA